MGLDHLALVTTADQAASKARSKAIERKGG
jgi:hypothetical protein